VLKIQAFFESHEFKVWYRWSLLLVLVHLIVFAVTKHTTFDDIHHFPALWDLLIFPVFLGAWKICRHFESGMARANEDSPRLIVIVWMLLCLTCGIIYATLILGAMILFCAVMAFVIFGVFFGLAWLLKRCDLYIPKMTMPKFVTKAVDYMLDRK
jgi:hypothetical protein